MARQYKCISGDGHIDLNPDLWRDRGVDYSFPDADPTYGARQEEAQKWILKLWEVRQK